jgi:hypothetical protein
MPFIFPKDYTQASPGLINDLSQGDGAAVASAEASAIAEAKGYLAASRYDTARAFQDIPWWMAGQAYAIGGHAYHANAVWVATAATVGEPGVSADWEPVDPRHPLLVMYVCDLSVWHLVSRADPRAVSEVRLQRKEDALGWLKRVAAGTVVDPDLPLVEEASTPSFFIDSRPPQDFRF